MRNNPVVILLGLSAALFLIFVAVLFVTLSRIKPEGLGRAKIFSTSKQIGVVPLKGVITESKRIVEQLDTFAEDPNVKGVVIRIDSPGGGVGPSQEIYAAIRRVAKQKPIYASMESVAASGGYYAAVGAKKIYANPGSITGSIGVIMNFADLSKLFEWAKVKPYALKTGKFKDIGSPTKAMSDEEKAVLQAMLDNVLDQFRRAVAEGRKLPMEKVISLSNGRVFSGEQAKREKLVDELGTFHDTVMALGKELGIDGKPALVVIQKKGRLLDLLMSQVDDADEDSGDSRFGAFAGRTRWLEVLVDEVLGRASRSGRAPYVGPMYLWQAGA